MQIYFSKCKMKFARGEPMAPSKGSHESAFAFDLHELNENNIHYL